jgi:hypothetical protein
MIIAQELIAAKSAELHQIADKLVGVVLDAVQQQTPAHEVEKKTFEILLRAGLATIQLLFECLGNGDLGDEFELPDGRTVKRSPQPQPRPYVSIFGPVQSQRFVYAEREGQKIELDEVAARLALPDGKFSYLLQDWDQSFAMEQPFGKVQQTVEKILGLRQYVDTLEHMNRAMSQQVEAFQAVQEPPSADEEGAIFVQTGDGKGVPIRRPADTKPIQDHRHKSGPKPDRKKMATVGAVYSINPFVRTPEEVVESLFRNPEEERPKRDRPRPCHKHLRAMLTHVNAEGEEINGRAGVFGWIADEMSQRHGQGHQPIVCIMDGEEALWEARDVFQEHVPMVDVLDLLHVTPRLWDAAAQFYVRDSAAAETFVRDRVLRILRGEVSAVVRGLRRMSTEHELGGKKKADVKKICAYFEKNRHRMCYHQYLKHGYPIASGVIEGACRHVIKDRLERTGMSWVRQGAQAMLELRCLYLTDQWDAFTKFRIERETQRLYPYRETLKTLSWMIAA